MLGILYNSSTAALTVLGACVGLGAYSFVVPVPIPRRWWLGLTGAWRDRP